MSTSRLFRRPAALVGGAGIIVALALVPAGSANAQVQGGFGVSAMASVKYTGTGAGGTCTLTSPTGSNNPSSTGKVLKDAGTAVRSVTLDAQYTNSLDSGDKTRIKGDYSAKTTLVKHSGDLASFTVSGKGKLTVSHSSLAGSDCQGAGQALAFTEVLFTEHKAGHLTLTRATVKSAASMALVENLKTNQELAFDAFQGDQSHAVGKVAVKPGNYALIIQNGITVGGASSIPFKRASASRTTKLTSGVNLTFTANK
jgi:hypothetical protein